VAIDNPHAPNLARCDEPGCNNTRPIAANDRRNGEGELAAAGWHWEVDYEKVGTWCPSHATQPVRRRRGGP
jgi:hypothetical protein